VSSNRLPNDCGRQSHRPSSRSVDATRGGNVDQHGECASVHDYPERVVSGAAAGRLAATPEYLSAKVESERSGEAGLTIPAAASGYIEDLAPLSSESRLRLWQRGASDDHTTALEYIEQRRAE
jgi:hypothetical protein